MKKIITSTALALMLTTSAIAAPEMAQFGTVATQEKGDILASNFIGMRIYATENEVAADTPVATGAEKEWDDIGEVNDVVLGTDGSVKAVILGVGGFLGAGEKDVSVTMDQIKIVRETDNANDYFLVVNANKAMLEEAPAYERITMDNTATQPKTGTNAANNDAATNTTTETAANNSASSDTTTTGATGNTTTSTSRDMLARPDVTREGYDAAVVTELTASDLEGASVYGINDEDVGEINRLILDDQGKITEVILDIGGFLGMGEHRIAVTMDELNIQRNKDGDFRVYIDATQANLEKQPAYNG